MANELRGFEGKLKVSGSFYDVKDYTLRINRSTARGDTTGQGRYQQHVVDKEVLELSFKAIRYTTINPHASPYFVMKTPANPNTSVYSNNDSAEIMFWPDGANVAVDSASYRATLVWESFDHTGNADSGLQMIDAKGTSTGAFKRPGDS